MKARKKGTNDPFEEIDCLQFKDSYVLYKADMIEFENESKGNKPDGEYWEQLRHQAAIAAMQTLIAELYDAKNNHLFAQNIATYSVIYANELVEQLKKK